MKRIASKNLFSLFFILILLSFFSLGSAQVGINTETPRTMLDVNGEMTVRTTNHLTKDAQVLYIDVDGKIGLTPIAVGSSMDVFYAATNDTILTDLASRFNSAKVTISIPLLANHVVYNNLGIENTGDYLKIAEDGVYQINAFVNFNINTALGNYTFLVAAIEISSDNGVHWTHITGSRPVFIQTLNGFQNQPHILPSVISYISSGDLFRLSFYRSVAGGGSILQGSNVNDMMISSDLSMGTRTYQLFIKKL